MQNSTYEYEASVLVNGKPVTEVNYQSRTYIEGRKDSAYELLFLNKTSRRVLVIPSVDGLSVLDGKPAGINSPGYVVEAWQTLKVPGWKVDQQKAAKFVFKPQSAEAKKDQTYVEAMGQNGQNQGTIGFMVFTEKPRWNSGIFTYSTLTGSSYNPTRRMTAGAADSGWDAKGVSFGANAGWQGANASNCMAQSSALLNCISQSPTTNSSDWEATSVDPDAGKSLGTGFGKATDFATMETTFEREFPSLPAAVFVLYYDTLRGLKRRGVPVEQFQRHYTQVQTQPNPFPSSPQVMAPQGCPLPPGWTRKG